MARFRVAYTLAHDGRPSGWLACAQSKMERGVTNLNGQNHNKGAAHRHVYLGVDSGWQWLAGKRRDLVGWWQGKNLAARKAGWMEFRENDTPQTRLLAGGGGVDGGWRGDTSPSLRQTPLCRLTELRLA